MENNCPFKIEIKEDTAYLTTEWTKSFEFDFIWQGKKYRATYWWDSNGRENIVWKNKPDFGEKENEIMEQIYEYIEKNIDKEFLNFSIVV
jgi:hypothetical protein